MKTFSDYGIHINGLTPNSRGEVLTQCPSCSHERKKKNARCLSVNIDKKVWICHHCGVTGGIGQAPQRAQTLHWEKPKYRKPEPKPQTLSGKVIEWLLGRGITEEVMIAAKIEADNVYFPQIEDYADAISFPYFRNGELINRKYRAIDDKLFRMDTGCELLLYGLDDIEEDYLVWTEGEMDRLSCNVAGITSVVSVPNGAPAADAKGNYESKFAFLDADWEKIDKVKKHILAVDADIPGQRLEEELKRRLGIEKCVRVIWPEGVKDSNELLMKSGADELRACIQDAEPYPIEGMIEIIEKEEQINGLYLNGIRSGLETGWPNLNEFYTVIPGQFTVVTGIPSSGKSNFLDCLTVNLARKYGWRFALFSPENLPVEQHMIALAEKYMGFPFYEGRNPRMTPEQLAEAMNWLQDRFYWILPNDESHWTVDNVLKIAGQACLRYGIRGLVIDPWNELESSRPINQTETEFISSSLKRIRVFARLRDIHVWVVVHPAKLIRDKEGNYPVPTLYDCAGSAHWRNKADNGICVWRDLAGADSEMVDIHIQKIRFRQTGKRGQATLLYEGVCATYREWRNYG